MNIQKIKQFYELLERQMAGEASAVESLHILQPTLDDSYCLYNLYEQWSQAFSYEPGRSEALAPILRLAGKLNNYDTDDTLRLFRESEWSELVQLRGPVEGVAVYECVSCHREYARMGTSGFYDAHALVCPQCGSVRFRSLYAEGPIPSCACGAHYPRLKVHGCPFCYSTQARVKSQLSPYQYFETHIYIREQGA